MIHSGLLFSAREHSRKAHSTLSPRYLCVARSIFKKGLFPPVPKNTVYNKFILATLMGILWFLRLLRFTSLVLASLYKLHMTVSCIFPSLINCSSPSSPVGSNLAVALQYQLLLSLYISQRAFRCNTPYMLTFHYLQGQGPSFRQVYVPGTSDMVGMHSERHSG